MVTALCHTLHLCIPMGLKYPVPQMQACVELQTNCYVISEGTIVCVPEFLQLCVRTCSRVMQCIR